MNRREFLRSTAAAGAAVVAAPLVAMTRTDLEFFCYDDLPSHSWHAATQTCFDRHGRVIFGTGTDVEANWYDGAKIFWT